MSATKYWGDERRADAIYAVYLRKVRYVPPQPYEGLPHYRPIDPDSQHLAAQIDTPNHLQWETVQERVIKAGTLSRLVESLINAEDSRMDSRQFNVFFATFRAFAEPEAVLANFIDWYETVASRHLASTTISTQGPDRLDAEPSTSQGAVLGDESEFEAGTPSTAAPKWSEPKCASTLLNTIRSILICWLDMYPEDFYALNDDAKFYLLARLIDFARSRSLYDLKHKARKVRERFKRVADEGGLAAQIPSLARYSYANAVCYDPHDIGYARHRAQMFDISRDNCVQIAEQLTFWDAVLFRELRPYQCQGSIWGKRHKNKANSVYSVRATIDQFNAVSERVMTSIVFPECAPDLRAKIIEKWIEIARELRALKNFSSLKAIVSSLQSEPVFRLKSTWAVVSKVAMAQFKQLATIFDADENGDESRARSILEAEGTAKSSPLKRSPATGSGALLGPNQTLHGGASNCRRTKSDVNLAADAQGTVPFLGTFLTDLTMIDQAHYDITPEGLINFEKRRREFEVLAKIRLFQSAARAYTVPMDQAFCIWFYYLPSINEKDCFTRSLEVEPAPAASSTPDTRRRRNPPFNGLYASPSASTSKFHSLTKIFGSATTPTDAVDKPPSEERRKLPAARLLHDPHQQQPSSSFVGQCSNDSGIHTEASTCSNLPQSAASLNGRTTDFADDSPIPGFGLSRVGAVSSLASSPASRATPTNGGGGVASLPPTPNGTLSARTGARVAARLALAADYAGSEFNPCYHFTGNASPSPAGARQSETRSADLNSEQKSATDSRTSTTAVRRHLNSTSSQQQATGLSATAVADNEVDESGGMSPAAARTTGNSDAIGGFHANAQYRPQQCSASANGANTVHHVKSVSTSSSGSSSFGTSSAGLPPVPPTLPAGPPGPSAGGVAGKDFHLARVGLDDSVFDEVGGADASNINYKCIKVENGDRMTTLIERALEKHMIDTGERANVYLVQLLPDGSEFKLPEHCNPFYAVAPDPTSPMLNFLLKKRRQQGAGDASADSSLLSAGSALTSASAISSDASSGFMAPSAKKLNKQRRSNLLRWSSGYL